MATRRDNVEAAAPRSIAAAALARAKYENRAKPKILDALVCLSLAGPDAAALYFWPLLVGALIDNPAARPSINEIEGLGVASRAAPLTTS